ncbi:MAG: GAF domain-containing protein [Bradymonadia bacterium]|jgi:signal transduction histidine kinase/putative methionine-R-sulfoxide reductase with GAF domain
MTKARGESGIPDGTQFSELKGDAAFYFARYMQSQEQLEAFQEIAMAVGTLPNLDDVLRIIVDKTTRLMRAERSTIFILDKEERCLHSTVAEGIGKIVLKRGEGIAGRVALTGEPINIVDVYKCEWFNPRFDEESGFKTRSCLCHPIWNAKRRELIGVVEVLNKRESYFSVADQELLAVICTQIATTITNHSLYLEAIGQHASLLEAHEQLVQRKEELDVLYTIERLAADASNLDLLLQSVCARCLQVLKCQAVGLVLEHNEQHTLYLSQYRKAGEPSFSSQCLLEHEGISARVTKSRESYVGYATNEHPIYDLSLNHLGIELKSVAAVALVHQDRVLGSLILANRRGGAIGTRAREFNDDDMKLLNVIANHIAPSIAAQLERESIEKEQRLTAIGQLLLSVLHDFKTPFSIISGYVELMAKQDDEAKRKLWAQTIDKQFDTIQKMTNEILLFARGETALLARKTLLSSTMQDIEELLRPEAERREIELEIIEEYKGHWVYDAMKIQRAVVNLARNAMEAIESHGKIIIRTYTEGEDLLLTIEDNGVGIPSHLGKSLFDAFVTYGKRGGSGLGLSIVKKAVEAHNGSISYENVEPHGTKFYLRLPATNTV